MKLTEKDKEFLQTLKQLVDESELWVELKPDRPSRMVLRGTYGKRVHKAFRMSRQGVRWRFYRMFNDVYVSAFETILFIEQIFGTQLRGHAVRISKERYALRREVTRSEFQSADTLTKASARGERA